MKFLNKLYIKIVFSLLMFYSVCNISLSHAENTSPLMPDKKDAIWYEYSFTEDGTETKNVSKNTDKKSSYVIGFDHYTKNNSAFGIGFHMSFHESSFEDLKTKTTTPPKQNYINGFSLNYNKYLDNIIVKTSFRVPVYLDPYIHGNLAVLSLNCEYKNTSNYKFYPVFNSGIEIILEGIPIINQDSIIAANRLEFWGGVGTNIAINDNIHLKPELCIGIDHTIILNSRYSRGPLLKLGLTSIFYNFEFELDYSYAHSVFHDRGHKHTAHCKLTMYL